MARHRHEADPDPGHERSVSAASVARQMAMTFEREPAPSPCTVELYERLMVNDARIDSAKLVTQPRSCMPRDGGARDVAE